MSDIVKEKKARKPRKKAAKKEAKKKVETAVEPETFFDTTPVEPEPGSVPKFADELDQGKKSGRVADDGVLVIKEAKPIDIKSIGEVPEAGNNCYVLKSSGAVLQGNGVKGDYAYQNVARDVPKRDLARVLQSLLDKGYEEVAGVEFLGTPGARIFRCKREILNAHMRARAKKYGDKSVPVDKDIAAAKQQPGSQHGRTTIEHDVKVYAF